MLQLPPPSPGYHRHQPEYLVERSPNQLLMRVYFQSGF